MIEYNLIREIECGEPCVVFSAENLARIARVAIDYSQHGVELKLQVQIDGKYATANELEKHTMLVDEKIDALLSSRV